MVIRKSLKTTIKFVKLSGRRGGLVVSALDSGSKGSGSGRVIVLCSLARHFTLTVPLFTQEHKWVPANCQGNLTKCWEVTCDGLASHPGGVATLLFASSYRNRDKLRQSWATRLVRLKPYIRSILSLTLSIFIEGRLGNPIQILLFPNQNFDGLL